MTKENGVELQEPERESLAVDSTVEETVCRRIIPSYRRKLDYILMLPELEGLLLEGLEALDLPGPRKGIGLRASLNALLMENKYELIRWAVVRYRNYFPATSGQRLDRMFGLDLFRSLDLDEHLTDRQWTRLKENLTFVLSRHHRRYKRAQALMFYRYRDLIEMTVNRTVFDPAKRHDAVQEGCLALLHAIDKVEDSSASFAAYAQSWIKRQVKNYLMGERFPVHVPINLASKVLTQNTGSEDSAETRKVKTADEKKAALLMERLRQPSVSLNEMAEDSAPLSEKLPDNLAEDPLASIAQKDLCELVVALIHNLTEKQKEVLEMRFGLSGEGHTHTLSEISRKIGISHQQVSMREKRALQKLQAALTPYLEEIYG